MSFVEVNKLRKAGRLKEAYILASNDLNAEPEDVWAKRAMAWVLYDYSKDNIAFEKKESFLKCLRQINSITIDAKETMFWECICQLVRSMIATCVRNNYEGDVYYDHLMEEIKAMPLPKPSEAYSSLLQNALRIKLTWHHFDAFCRWWDFTNFREDDFSPRQVEEKTILPLAERAIMAYSKALLLRHDHDFIEEWLPKLDMFIKQHPNYLYLPYYKAKLLIKTGALTIVTDELRLFVSKKKTEFWAWDLLGDATLDEGLRMTYYCKAMTCKSKEEMTLTLREKIVSCFISKKAFNLAKAELENIIAIRKRNKWKITPEITEYIKLLHDCESASKKDLTTYYQTNSDKAEEALFGSKQFRGKVRKNAAGFAFISDVFVPSFMADNFVDGQLASGHAVKSYDKKKSKWGWRAVSIVSESDTQEKR